MTEHPATRATSELAVRDAGPLVPAADQLRLLSPIERSGFALAHRMNLGAWKRFWTFCQRHIGSLWIYISTYNLMQAFGLENFEKTDATRPILIVSNHR